MFVAAVAWLIGCDEDCPTCPKPPEEQEYQFLYSFAGTFTTAWVFTYSTKTGEVMDSSYYGTLPFNDARFTSDGKYAVYTVFEPGEGATWVTDFSSGDTLAIAYGVSGDHLSLFADQRHVLVSETTKLTILSIPDLQIVFQRSHANGYRRADTHPSLPLAYVPSEWEDSLLTVEYSGTTVVEYKFALKSLSGSPARSVQALATLDGNKVILWAGPLSGGESFIQVRDARTLSLVDEYRPGHGFGCLHPDGVRVFFFAPWIFDSEPSSVWELNLETRLMRRIIDGYDYSGAYPFRGFDPVDMDITPDGRYAFFIGGEQRLSYGLIIKYDLQDYRIVRTFHPRPGVGWLIRVHPKSL